MKEEIIKIINEVYNKMDKETTTDSFLEYDKDWISTDTGFAFDGIKFFKEKLIEEIENKLNHISNF